MVQYALLHYKRQPHDARMSTFLSSALAKSADRINVASDLTPGVVTRDNKDADHFDFEGEFLN